jgi:hypothetical protein
VTSTVFTLVVIPAAYTFIDDIAGLIDRLTARFRRPRELERHVPRAEVLDGAAKP